MLLCAQFPTSFQSNYRPLPETFVKVESCRACDFALRSLGGRVSLGGGRLTLGGRTLTRRCFQSGLKGRRVNLTPEAVERGLKYSLSLCGDQVFLSIFSKAQSTTVLAIPPDAVCTLHTSILHT